MAPNMRAVERLEVVQDRLKNTDRDYEDARKRAKRAKDDFQAVKEKRFEAFSKAFSHISEQIGLIYKDLTRDASLPMGGQAYEIPVSSNVTVILLLIINRYLDIEDGDEPYLDGIKYHAMPPLKRFRDMEHLSGGRRPWLLLPCSLQSTAISRLHSLYSMKSTLRWTMPTSRRLPTILKTMRDPECNSS